MPSTTFVARRPGPFAALVQAPEIGGLRLDPHPPVRVLDRYYDTDDGALLRQGWALCVREQAGRSTVGLRDLEGSTRSAPADLALVTPPSDTSALALPPSGLADTVTAAVGPDSVRQLLSIRQYRTPRLVLRGDRTVGVVSFDVVVYEVPGARVVSNEVEIEPSEGESLAPLEAAFVAHGLEAAPRSKLERAVVRLPRGLDEPALLLPDEARILDAAAAGEGDRALRAQVLLLDGRGFRSDTIAAQTGLSMGRVRALRQRFRADRLAALDDDLATPPTGAEGDGLAAPVGPEDMADLLDLFSAHALPDTPHFSGAEPAPPPRAAPQPVPPPPAAPPPVASSPAAPPPEAARLGTEGAEPAPEARTPRVETVPSVVPEPVREEAVGAQRPPVPTPRDPYPIVLGPVAPPARPASGDGLRRPAALATEPTPPVLPGDMPVLRAAETLLSYHVSRFDARAERFALTRAPSDARRLLVALHGLRLAVETFDRVLPNAAARRVVAALRPLATALGDALDAARAAATTRRADLARLAAERVGQAADRLGSGPAAWGDRARRLAGRLDASARDGLRSDDAPVVDDYVGAPGDAPTATRLRHVLGSAVWARFEAVRAFEDDLDAPTADLAAHLAVALSGLHAVVALAGEPDDLLAAIASAERQVVAARGRHLVAGLGDGASSDALAAVADIWREVTAGPFRQRLAAVVAAV